MKIGNVGQSKGVSGTKRKSGASGAKDGGFADKLRDASGASGTSPTDESGGVEQTQAMEGVDALLAMQEVGDSSDGQARQKGVKYGEDLLDRLNTLQDALLAGGIPKSTLMEMAQRLRAGRAKFQDPRLNEILDEIELRVEVEIAKYATTR